MNELVAQQLADQLLHSSGLKKWPRDDRPSTAYDVAKTIARHEGFSQGEAEEIAERVRHVVTLALAAEHPRTTAASIDGTNTS